MRIRMFFRVSCFMFGITCLASFASGQTETATIVGRVTDSSDAIVTNAEVQLHNVERGTSTTVSTNDKGLYLFASIQPGQYRITVRKTGFRELDLLGLIINVQAHVEQNFRLQVGSIFESVTVEGGAPLVETENAAVSTVVERHFAEDLPLNGRSFQTLIQLTPGVVLTANNLNDGGQFSVNGQRAAANYWTVDGVSANIGVSSNGIAGNGIAGALPSFSAQGGTNSLVSVDAMQEFRIQTSTYAPEFGRTPGAQVSIVTRSGTNQLHGTVFDYLRNDVFDANDWFANNHGLAKPKEQQNDFGGTFNGPVLKDRTFFFFTYEGLRLRLPQVAETLVPDMRARNNAIPSMQPFFAAFPVPNGPDDATSGFAQFNASFSNSSRLDAYSLRLDHKLNDRMSLFVRYNYSPSNLIQRGFSSAALSVIAPLELTGQTATLGGTWLISPHISNDLRLNYSKTKASGTASLDNFGGAIPLAALPFPSPYTANSALFELQLASTSTAHTTLEAGKMQRNLQRQFNLVDSLSFQKGAHSLKAGVDFRRLSPIFDPGLYGQGAFFIDLPSAEAGNVAQATVISGRRGTLLFRNLGVFAQDTWRVMPRLTMTYGIRWDVDFPPLTLDGPKLLAVTGFNLSNLSNLALGPSGSPQFKTTFGNLAPRFGLAYRLSENQEWGTVLRAGMGIFYDLATQEVGNLIAGGKYPFGAATFIANQSFPLGSAASAPPAIISSELQQDVLFAFDPHLKLPYTLEWNLSLEQPIGRRQSFSASYVGSGGRKLLQTAFIVAPNPSFGFGYLVSNSASSNYNGLQLQYRRRLLSGFQALASYTWSHSIDDASAGSFGNVNNALVPGSSVDQNRGPSDFDVRNAFSVGLTYDIRVRNYNGFTNLILKGWSVQNIVQGRSASPVTLFDNNFFELRNSFATVRPDVVPGQPFYLYGSQCVAVFGSSCPGGKGFNPAAFAPPPADINGNPLRQGTLARNALRGMGLVQWDFALHRDFPIHKSAKLQFRAEIFNVLNHPNFGPPVADISNASQFGRSAQMLGQSLTGGNANLASGAFSPLYQLGGPRSMQLALKLEF
jgi:hypothetical protein